MKQSVTITEHDYDKALEKALESLNLTKDQVDIEVLEEKKGLFSKNKVTLKVSKKKDNTEEQLNRSKELAEKGLEKIPSKEEKEEAGFILRFEVDGVFAIMKNRETLGNDKKELITYLSKKKVQDVDSKTLFDIDEESIDESIQIAPAQEEVLIDSEVKVTPGKDGLEGNIILTKPYGGKIPTVEEVIENSTRKKSSTELTGSRLKKSSNTGFLKSLFKLPKETVLKKAGTEKCATWWMWKRRQSRRSRRAEPSTLKN